MPIESWVVRRVDDAHAALAELGHDGIRAELRAGNEHHEKGRSYLCVRPGVSKTSLFDALRVRIRLAHFPVFWGESARRLRQVYETVSERAIAANGRNPLGTTDEAVKRTNGPTLLLRWERPKVLDQRVAPSKDRSHLFCAQVWCGRGCHRPSGQFLEPG